MARPTKVSKPPEPLRSGERVHRKGSDSVWIITRIDENEADLCLEGTDFEWFRYPVSDLNPVKN